MGPGQAALPPPGAEKTAHVGLRQREDKFLQCLQLGCGLGAVHVGWGWQELSYRMLLDKNSGFFVKETAIEPGIGTKPQLPNRLPGQDVPRMQAKDPAPWARGNPGLGPSTSRPWQPANAGCYSLTSAYTAGGRWLHQGHLVGPGKTHLPDSDEFSLARLLFLPGRLGRFG